MQVMQDITFTESHSFLLDSCYHQKCPPMIFIKISKIYMYLQQKIHAFLNANGQKCVLPYYLIKKHQTA